MLIKADLCEY